jgi:Xaa-Pro dipeptidase
MKTERLNRVRAGMEKAGLVQTLVTSTESVYYLTGAWIEPGERLMALLIGKGECRLVVNRMFPVPPTEGLSVTALDDAEDGVAALSAFIAPGPLGVDKAWPSRFLLALMEMRPDVRPVNGSGPVDEARMIKDGEEIAALRASSNMNDRVMGLLRRSLAEGETELDAARRYVDMGIREGASGPGFPPLVCFGAGAAEPHHATGSARLKRGDAVILDVGLDVNHALSDMTRTVFFGGATDEERRVYDVVRRANEAGRAAVRPGAALSEIDRAARGVIEAAGYGGHFLHRTGHGLGLEVHEPPDVSASSRHIARPGMVFSVEPGVYLPGRFGVRVEDLVLVTEDGCEVLNHLDRDFLIV